MKVFLLSKGAGKTSPMRLLTAALLLLFAVSAMGQNHPELVWHTFETEHFVFHYHDGTERSARMAMTIAEEVYPNVTAVYDWEPADKTQIVIQDTDDYANGGAYYFDNKIVLWASPADFTLRGNHNWMRNVFTHEFSHIISLGKSMRFPISMPAAFIQVLDREKPVRDNIILEYPRGIGVMPFANVIMPMWLAEGMAQYMYDTGHQDYWDSIRDMLLRDQALNGSVYSLDELAHFGKKGTGNESVYNSGYAYVKYLSGHYGPEFLGKLAAEIGKPGTLSFDRAFRKVTGEDAQTVYSEYVRSITDEYMRKTAAIRSSEKFGSVIFSEGPGNFNASLSPDGDKMVFASSRNQDYMSQTSLYLRNAGSEDVKKISGRTRGQIAWSADGNTLFYAKQVKPDIYGSIWYDLNKYDLVTDKEDRLTHGQRIYSVTLSGSDRIFVITVKDGTHNIGEYDVNSGEIRPLTKYRDGEQVFGMAVSKDEKTLYFDMALTYGRDVYALDLEDGSISAFLQDPRCDIRNPMLDADGRFMYYSSDRNGIFNIYRKSMKDGAVHQLTNVTGAAIMPAPVPGQDSLVYTIYRDGSYHLAGISCVGSVAPENSVYRDYKQPAVTYDPSTLDQFSSRTYERTYSRLFFMPYAMVDYGKVKLGTVLYQSEVLNKFNMTASAAVNSLYDTDLYARLDYSEHLPTLYVEGYYISYHLDAKTGTLYDFYPEENTYSFYLWEAVAGLQYNHAYHHLDLSVTHSNYDAHVEVKDLFNPQIYGYYYTYYTGTRYQLTYSADFRGIDWNGNINPRRGWHMKATTAWDQNDFIHEFGINADFGTLEEIYKDNSTARLEVEGGGYFQIPGFENTVLSLETTSGWLANSEIDSFFHYFGGGMPGLKGYPYYTIEGTNLSVLTTTLRFPLITDLRLNLHPFYFDKIYLGIYHQIGDAWRGGFGDINPKQDAGAELRFGGYSWYAYPLALSLDAVYAFNEFEVEQEKVGQAWRYYVKLLFEF